jgi:hypothetical protein
LTQRNILTAASWPLETRAGVLPKEGQASTVLLFWVLF